MKINGYSIIIDLMLMGRKKTVNCEGSNCYVCIEHERDVPDGYDYDSLLKYQ